MLVAIKKFNLIILIILFDLILLFKISECNDNLRVAYEWNEIDFNYPNLNQRQQEIESEKFIQKNIIPVGIEVYQSRLFITFPRFKKGVPASLAYLDLNENSTKSPKLNPFPSWEAHHFEDGEIPEIVSPMRVRADKCGRLWVLDTGVADLLENPKVLNGTKLLVYDLHNDNLLRNYVFPSEFIKENSLFANIAVEDTDCEDSYAYAADLGGPGLVVYSWKNKKGWKFNHNYFHSDPLAGNYSIDGINFQWDDGLFGLAISKANPDGYATLYFHPLSSTMEFSVSTAILRNETLTSSNDIYQHFKILGSRGPNAQAGSTFLDQLTGVLFYTLPNLYAVACWKTSNRAYTIKSQGRVYMSPLEMVFPNDVKVDDQDRLWVLSDRLHQFMYSSLNSSNINFRILTAHVRDAIENTACDTKTKPLPDLITKLGDILRPSTKVFTQSGVSMNKLTYILIYLNIILMIC